MGALRNFLQGFFSALTLIALFLGTVAFLLFFAGFIAGGPTATKLAVTAGKIMQWGIKLAAIAVAAGIVDIYLSRRHKLTLSTEKEEKAT